MTKLRIKLVRSQIGYDQSQRRTVKALGLKRLQHEVEHEDTPTIRGMVHKVRHLVSVSAGEES
jgi:large subunit ribosomal protein L30